MREILFRGKRMGTDEWVYGFYASDRENHYIVVHDGMGFLWSQIDPATVGQYTGLTDKNGVKIFEGDIFRHPRDSSSIYVVSWDKGGGFTIFTDDTGFDPKCIEIIGNIHDNKELL